MGRKLILRNNQSPGDILMLTAAVRDLHRCYPGEYVTDVRTSCEALWENNPYLTPLDEDDPDVTVIDCKYPLVHRSSQSPHHFVSGFSDFLSDALGRPIRVTDFRGDVHLSGAELEAPGRVGEIVGAGVPYWIVVAGGKYDCTVKWWGARRYQGVVDALRDEVLFVQVGETPGHYHPQLHGTIDLRGQTSLREIIALTYHAQGVLCPITFLMHLAAAVPTPGGEATQRGGVVVAGGRESPHWEAYPWHQFIHTVGALPCCLHGGCWKFRTQPLGDGDRKDEPDKLCVDVVDGSPRCMDMISVDEVAGRVRRYFEGGALRALGREELDRVAPHRVRSLRERVLS